MMYDGWKRDAWLMTPSELQCNLRNNWLPRHVNAYLATVLVEKRKKKNVKEKV